MGDDLGLWRRRRIIRFLDHIFHAARIAIAGRALGTRRQVLQIGADEIQPLTAIDLVNATAATTSATTAAIAIASTALFARFSWLGLTVFGARFGGGLAFFAFATALAATTATAATALAVITLRVTARGNAGRSLGLIVFDIDLNFVGVFIDSGCCARVRLFGFDLDIAALLLLAAATARWRGACFDCFLDVVFEPVIQHDDFEVAGMHRR